MELTQGVDGNFVMPCMLPGHVSKGPFHRYGVRRHLVNRARNDVLHKNKAPPLPPKVPKKLDFFLWLRGGIVTGLTNCTVHQWQFSSIRSPFSLASSWCVHLLWVVFFFSVLTEIFDLEEIHNDRSRLWAFFLPQILHHGRLGNPSG